MKRVLRVAGVLAVVYVVALVLAARQAAAEVDELMLGLGAELLRFPDSTQDEVRRVSLNGASIEMTTGITDRPIDEVLAYFEARCQERDGGVSETIQRILDEGNDLGVAAADVDTTMTMNTGTRGFVACLDPGEGADLSTSESLLDRAERALATGRIGDLGHLRYIYVERYSEEQGRYGTHIVSISSDDDLDVKRLFPETADAPGRDPEGVPRAENLQRILSAFEVGKPYGMTIYSRRGGDPARLAAWYRRELPRAGWDLVEMREGERVEIDGQHLLTGVRDERLVTVVVGRQDDLATVTVLTSDEEP
ncbi:MAG: hypothetical protein H6723_08250 [Sandaracinus sp.]|nr:hypothetical protein [Sandaracinus sp.]